MKCRSLMVALVLLASSVTTSVAQPADGLKFFKNYFLTGDYVVAGVGLNGRGVNGVATGTIEVGDAVPADADVVAAYLYWQVVGKESAGADAGSVGATFNGHPLVSSTGPYAKSLGSGTPPCWSSGGGTGASNGANKTYSFRVDALRFFDIDEQTGKLKVNGPHVVQVPDGGQTSALGATLVLVYRRSGDPLRAFVIYDGAYTMDQSTEGMWQTIRGFYDAGRQAKITHIVGSGQANKSEKLYFNGALIATNPFSSSAGAHWDNPTFTVDPFAGQPAGTQVVDTVTTSVDHAGFGSFDCLTWSAVVFRTDVNDRDADGLLDAWETTSNLVDPNGQPLPDLPAMGADVDVRDVFVEIGYMASPGDGGHSHLPGHEALALVGEAFERAPGGAIRVHFDLGKDYPIGPADRFIIRDVQGKDLARGGEQIDEQKTVCQRGPGDAPWVCQYPGHPGTMGWKTGFLFLRDEVLSGPAVLPGQDDPCDLPGNSCVRRFDRNRKDVFRYGLFAHAIGLPKSDQPCLKGGQPAPTAANGTCAASEGLIDNPEFHVPRTNTGVGDFPGGDFMVTLGGFPDADGRPVGTPFMQASTMMHEMGHGFERRHGGGPLEPNCKPTYLSVMNYLYQLRGLLDDSGSPHLDFSGAVLPTVDEANLSEGWLSSLPYRIGYYAPLAGSYLEGKAAAARKHCDGSELRTELGPDGQPVEPPSVRIDARRAADAIDWNADGDVTDNGLVQDVNFNGRSLAFAPPDTLAGADDWRLLLVNQVGGRRSTGALYQLDASGRLAVGPLSLDSGRGDLGRGDLGRGDLGRGDLGRGDLGRGDLGRGDLGRGDLGRGDLGTMALGRGDLGRGDLGGGDLFVGDPNNPGGELDFETAGDLAKTPPNTFDACVVGGDDSRYACRDLQAPLHQVKLSWLSPNVGGVSGYQVYRVAGEALSPGQIWIPVGAVETEVTCPDGTPSSVRCHAVLDQAPLVDGASYTYFAVARYQDGIVSDPSNLVTIAAQNDPAQANADHYTVQEDGLLNVPAPGVLANDADPDTPGVTLQVHASSLGTRATTSGGQVTLAADGSFAYAPKADFSGTDTFTYLATDGSSATALALVEIAVTAVNDAPVAVNDEYSMPAGGTLSVPVPGVLANDSDVDGLSLTAVLVSGPAQAQSFALNANGSFTFTPLSNFTGAVTFTYRASDDSAVSGVATVRINVKAYTFHGLQNAPPATITKTKAGSSVPMKWQYLDGATPVDSSAVGHRVTVYGPLSAPAPLTRTITNTDPGSSSFRYDAAGKSWYFNLQTKDPNGVAYPVGDYQVTITPMTPGYLASPTFPLKLTK